MSRLSELLTEHCSGGVYFAPLGTCCKVKTGPAIDKKFIAANPGEYPVVNSGADPLGFVSTFNTEDDPIGVASRGSVGLISWTDGKFFRGPLNYSVSPVDRELLLDRYLWFYLHSRNHEVQALATHQGIPALNKRNLVEFRVPIPPMIVQREIAATLDKFLKLLTELEAELELRRRQYEHYRDALCASGETVRLAELGTFFGGLTGKSKKDFDGGNAAFVSYMNVFSNLQTDVEPSTRVRIGDGERQNRLRRGDILFTTSSESAAEVGMASVVTAEPPRPLYLNSFCFGFRPHPGVSLEPEYAKHLFRSATVRRQIVRSGNGVTRINVSRPAFSRVAVAIPGGAEQLRRARILDALDALVSDQHSGLPAEIAARRKQYQYYRDLFLTFPEKTT